MAEWAASHVSTPIGTFRIVYRGREVRLIDLLERGQSISDLESDVRLARGPFPPGSPPAQLGEYFRGKRKDFDLEATPESASEFDRAIWKQLQ
ncbi:MAG TPA: hypothetical protein VJS68_01970, partial [Thermoplasmata archaeon]|nr:hypothetical protein [Thermoplasmata archaeon]